MTLNIPLDKPFEKQDPSSPLSELVLRLVVNFYSENPYIIGSAVMLAGHLIMTARHVIEDILEKGVDSSSRSIEISSSIVAVQIIDGKEYVVWEIVDGVSHPNFDIMLFRLSSNPAMSEQATYKIKSPIINPFPPEIGKPIAAMGYRKGKIVLSKNTDGTNHIDLNDELIVTTGIVQEVYEQSRDKYLLKFPCYQANIRADGGMSGGAVFNQDGHMCGIICSNIATPHGEESISYISTLWPLFKFPIHFDRGHAYERGIIYPAWELARDRQIIVSNFDDLTRWLVKLPD